MHLEVWDFIRAKGDYLCLVLGTMMSLIGITLFLRFGRGQTRFPKALWLVTTAVLAVGWWSVEGSGEEAHAQNRTRISALAPTYARELERMGHATIGIDTPPDNALYQAMIAAQIQWQQLNPHAHDIYTMRKLEDGSNVLLVDSESDYDGDHRFTGQQEGRTPIGTLYDVEDPGLEQAFQGQANFDTKIISDDWGTWVSAFVPMRDADGAVEAVLGVDFNAAEWLAAIAQARRNTISSVAMALLAILCAGLFFYFQQADLERRIAAEQRMQLTIRQMPLGFIEWNTRAEIVQWNPAAERIFGHSAKDVLGKRIFDLIVAPSARDHVDQIWKDLLENRNVSHSINDNLSKDGRIITCEWFNTPLIGREGHVVTVFSLMQDVTEKVRIEKHLQQSERLNAVGELAAGVAHDFNNILTVITGHTGLLLGQDDLSSRERFEVKRINEAASRAGGLTRQLLAFSRQQAMFPKPLRVQDVINSSATMLSRWLGEHVEFNIHIADDVSPVEADAAMLEQVITNLVLNARDALQGPGSITVALDSVIISHETASQNAEAREGPTVCLSVADTGSGIAPEHQARLFEPFFSTKPTGSGTGLGLSVVHGIVQQHRGWITVNSEPGQGTTFRVFLPPTSSPVRDETVISTSPLPPRTNGPTRTVLLVEDEELVRELARLTLEGAGFRVVEAGDGLEALRIWRKSRNDIHLLFTDMVMPNGMTGRQLAAELQADRPDLPIIYASGYSMDVIAPEFTVSDRVLFLAKPYLTDQLLAAVRHATA